MKKFCVQPLLIAPPFGHYLSLKGTTSICGSYTLERRPGLLKQIFKTLRPIRDGWLNAIGFRNKGLSSIKFKQDNIYSFAAFTEAEWEKIEEKLPMGISLEVNIGCPNAITVWPSEIVIKKLIQKSSFLSVKLPPDTIEKTIGHVEMFYNLGVTVFHCFNSIPTSKGGQSGARIKAFSLPAIKALKEIYTDIHIIGGGGIYNLQDLEDYKKAGADFFSLSTIWFSPIKAFKLLREYRREYVYV
jgi:dihydroorotate dehydrogenase